MGATTIQFRPRARILRTIGDQLISGPEAAVIELVKNSYDADASRVVIRFVPPLTAGEGGITVSDDGHGMTVADIRDRWMEPATTSKAGGRSLSSKGRRMLGSKGIGRFAAAKLGARMQLLSVSGRSGERTAVMIPGIDWSDFSGDKYLSDVALEYVEEASDADAGTTIEIWGLNESWSRSRIERLLLELRRLVPPVEPGGHPSDFRIYLDLSDCTEEDCGFDGGAFLPAAGDGGTSDAPVGAFEVLPFTIIGTSDYEIAGSFDDAGVFEGTMEIRRAGQAPSEVRIEVPLGEDEEPCGRVDVRLSVFDREADVLKDTMRRAGLGELTIAKARQILNEAAGVAIYRDGFRVRPYGDPVNDWLSLDTRRVQDPSLRVGHNQVVGLLGVEPQEGSDLVERSSREGFEENASFRRLRSLVRALFARVVEPRRQAFREAAGLSRRQDATFEEMRTLSELRKIRALVDRMPVEDRAEAVRVIEQQSSILTDRIGQMQERQRLLEAQSSLGAIVGEILHEGAPSANFVAAQAPRLRSEWEYVGVAGPKGDRVRGEFPEKLLHLAENGERLRALFENIRPLAAGRRGAPRTFNATDAVRSAVALFRGRDVAIELVPPGGLVELIGFRDDLSTALVNMLSNAVYWLEDARTPDPRIVLRIEPLGDVACISVQDNGPGIPGEFHDRIFDLRFTLKSDGTGLGLNISREALDRSGAKLFFDAGHVGGARFEIRFPRYEGPDQ